MLFRSDVDAALVTLPSNEQFFSITGCYVGSHHDGERALSPIVRFGSPVETRLATVPYLEI